jgi:hypothetical protein
MLKREDPRAQDVFDYLVEISRSEGINTNFKWDGDEVLVLP